MMFRTHLVFALLCGLLFLGNFSGNKYLFLIIVLASGALPDIDHPKSKLGKKFWFLSKPFNFLFGHRKLFHSVFVAVGLSFIIWKFFGEYWLPVFIGYVSHILVDGLTLNGINFIYPINQLRLQGFIETGKTLESWLFWVIVLLDLFFLFKLF
tara:strand:+ start:1518 stop:1976 length:459 start_codon:yes stop_codon:yes gene_type:complete